MVGNMFFQDIEQVGMENASPKKSTFSIEWRKTCSRGGGGGAGNPPVLPCEEYL